MSVTQETTAVGADGLYQRIQQFYAEQMQLLDGCRVREWAATFTEDGVFAANAQPEPVVGRAAITAAARSATDASTAAGIQRRHWLGMVSVGAVTEGAVRARCYALVIETPRGGRPALAVSTVCEDVLVPGADGGWLVRERHVFRDDLPPAL
ncbi:hypothetical protein OK074_2612 [Actinobacteria bacterium OK074]|nr:hypothetical protein OK074_2612 [Actinobacteria bacterium OK074]